MVILYSEMASTSYHSSIYDNGVTRTNCYKKIRGLSSDISHESRLIEVNFNFKWPFTLFLNCNNLEMSLQPTSREHVTYLTLLQYTKHPMINKCNYHDII